MKTLCKNNVSIYLFEDTKPVSLNTNNITVGDPVDLTISDCSASDTTLYTDVTTPADYVGGKYMFDGTTWSANPKWVEPPAEEEEAE